MNGKKRVDIVRHRVEVNVDADGRLVCTPCCVHAAPGDRITWVPEGARPLAVIIKAFEGPLESREMTAGAHGTPIETSVRLDAKPGFYPYAAVMPGGDGLLVADPEIIVPPPDGRGGGGR